MTLVVMHRVDLWSRLVPEARLFPCHVALTSPVVHYLANVVIRDGSVEVGRQLLLHPAQPVGTSHAKPIAGTPWTIVGDSAHQRATPDLYVSSVSTEMNRMIALPAKGQHL